MVNQDYVARKNWNSKHWMSGDIFACKEDLKSFSEIKECKIANT